MEPSGGQDSPAPVHALAASCTPFPPVQVGELRAKKGLLRGALLKNVRLCSSPAKPVERKVHPHA